MESFGELLAPARPPHIPRMLILVPFFWLGVKFNPTGELFHRLRNQGATVWPGGKVAHWLRFGTRKLGVNGGSLFESRKFKSNDQLRFGGE